MFEIINLFKNIRGQGILEDISLSIEKGQIFGFLGPNGAGKTTTILTILGLYRQDSGLVLLNGRELDHDGRINVGFMLDEDGLYSELTVRENLQLYAKIYNIPFDDNKKAISSKLKKFDLDGYTDKKTATLSKGMRQKLAFIRATLHSPSLLILDEPFTSLDPETQVVLREELVAYAKHNAAMVLMSSHNLYEVERICHKIAIIRKGKIDLMETIENIKAQIENKNLSIEDIYFNSGHI